MNWEAIGAVGEVLGAIAVVASLSYLAVQIRNQNRETRLAAMHETLIALREHQAPLQTDRHLADLINRGLENIDSLESDEATQFASFLNGGCRHWEDSFYQYNEGRLDERIWESICNQYSPIRSTPGFQRYWELRGSYYSNDFREYVDGLKDSKVWIALKKDLQS